MTERLAAEDFLFDTLNVPVVTILATGGVHPLKAPDGTKAEDTPYVVFSPAAGPRDEYANDRLRVYTEMVYQVRATCGRNIPTADAIEAAFVPLLESASGGELKVARDGYLIDCLRLGPLNTLSTDMGRAYRYAGARYRITVRKDLSNP